MSAPCSDAVAEQGLDGNYSAFSNCWAEHMAANPELMAASRYVNSVESGSEVSFLAANPELMVARVR